MMMRANGGNGNSYESVDTVPFTITDLAELQSGWTNKK